MNEKYDVIVIGGGHAGVEAALSASRLGMKTLMIVGSIMRISNMPCNPSIGGPAKGIIVREIDALGGQMGKVADETLLQIKMLNLSKGPAVRALRAQSDKVTYPRKMREICFNQENLDIKEAYVEEVNLSEGAVSGVTLEGDIKIDAKAVIIASGTYLASRVLCGHEFHQSGPDNERTTTKLSECLKRIGFDLIRLKTGTPPRIKTNSIDFSKTTPQPGDSANLRFSDDTPYEVIRPIEKQALCYLTYTTSETHQIIRENLDKSSMYGGVVEGVGPRYCPSSIGAIRNSRSTTNPTAAITGSASRTTSAPATRSPSRSGSGRWRSAIRGRRWRRTRRGSSCRGWKVWRSAPPSTAKTASPWRNSCRSTRRSRGSNTPASTRWRKSTCPRARTAWSSSASGAARKRRGSSWTAWNSSRSSPTSAMRRASSSTRRAPRTRS